MPRRGCAIRTGPRHTSSALMKIHGASLPLARSKQQPEPRASWRSVMKLNLRVAASASVIVILSAGTVLSQKRPEGRSGGNPDPTIAFVGLRLDRGDGRRPLSASPDCEVSAKTLELLRNEGFVGTLDCASSGGLRTFETRGRIVVIMTHQIDAPVELPLAVDEIVYVQTDDGWRSYPANARTTFDSFRLFPDPDSPDRATRFSVRARGGTTGGTMIIWPKPVRE